MGHPIDLFIDEGISDGFLCAICRDVLKDPVVMNPCEHTYCQTCAEQWRLTSKTCPTDRQRVTSLKKVQRYFMSVLNELKMRCPFNGTGCTATFKLGDFTDHDERCPFNPENQKECAGGCGAILNQAQIKAKTHNCVEYLKQQLTSKDKLVQAKDTELDVRMAQLASAQEQISKLAQKEKDSSSRLESELRARLEELERAQEQIGKLKRDLQNEKDQNSRLEAELKAKETAQELAAVAMESSSRGHLKRKLDIDIEDEIQAEGETENETEHETEDETEEAEDETENETEAEEATGYAVCVAENVEPEVKAVAAAFALKRPWTHVTLFEMEYSDIKNISAQFSQTIASVVVAEVRKSYCSRSHVIVQKEIAAILNGRPGPAGRRKWVVWIQDFGFWNPQPYKTIPINATTRVNLNFRNIGLNILVYKLGSVPIAE